MLKFDINLGPYVWVEQHLSHGRSRLVKCFSRKSYGGIPVFTDPAKRVVVRFVRKGKMYAGMVPKKFAPVRNGSAASRPATPKALGGMLGDLTAIEAANRLRVHQQHNGR